MELAHIIKANVTAALSEDIGHGDVTAELIPTVQTAKAHIVTRESAILCGRPWVEEVLHQVDSNTHIEWQAEEGQPIYAGQVVCVMKGKARSLLTAERTMLNFLQLLSGTATVARQYVEQLMGTSTRLLDTRKTLPGLRMAQKYAVRCGGGHNHRMGLYDAFLLKENHISVCGSVAEAIVTARTKHPGKRIEIEVETLAELEEAITAGADIILLDNFSLSMMRKAVQINAGVAKLEISGNVTLENIAEVAKTGVDFISVGALTKHVRAVDLSMRFVEAE